MEKNKFNSIVIEKFEDLKEKYLKDIEFEWDGEIMGSTILIEDYLLPYLYENINNEKIMSILSDFLEELISLKDDFCEEVLYSSFFEKIHFDNMEEKFIKYFKAETKAFFNKLKF
jgi:hypothetical protein